MHNLSNWNYYYNLEGTEEVRANLVYTPYVSPDKKTFCMSFNRDRNYHQNQHENSQWTEELLNDRFEREIRFHKLASTIMPTLNILDIDETSRRIYLEWFGDDFYMQGLMSGGYDNVLPDWQDQWCDLIKKMWGTNIYKLSLHPNSWVAHDGVLIPFNWFFCFDQTDLPVTARSLLIQISSGRQEKLGDLDVDKPYTPKEAQYIAFNSFRTNYPPTLIDTIIKSWATT
jgi:hypothetical protein